MSTPKLYTVCKFIPNHSPDLESREKYPLISRSLGKVALPISQFIKLSVDLHKDTFWLVEVLTESGRSNKGVIEIAPHYQVAPIPLLPGMFDIQQKDHWVFLVLRDTTAIKPYYVPQTIKNKYLDPKSGICAVCCVPYWSDHLAYLLPLS